MKADAANSSFAQRVMQDTKYFRCHNRQTSKTRNGYLLNRNLENCRYSNLVHALFRVLVMMGHKVNCRARVERLQRSKFVLLNVVRLVLRSVGV